MTKWQTFSFNQTLFSSHLKFEPLRNAYRSAPLSQHTCSEGSWSKTVTQYHIFSVTAHMPWSILEYTVSHSVTLCYSVTHYHTVSHSVRVTQWHTVGQCHTVSQHTCPGVPWSTHRQAVPVCEENSFSQPVGAMATAAAATIAVVDFPASVLCGIFLLLLKAFSLSMPSIYCRCECCILWPDTVVVVVVLRCLSECGCCCYVDLQFKACCSIWHAAVVGSMRQYVAC